MKGRAIRYSREELRFVSANRGLARAELHARFQRRFRRRDVSVGNIKSLCTRRGWDVGRRRRWTAKDDARFRALYPHRNTTSIARALHRTVSSCYGRAAKLGLEKTEAYLASPAACRLRRANNPGVAFRFEKGHIPANKGLRRPGWGPGRMRDTQFKKGQSGWNWRPIGNERVADGYTYTKIADERRVPWTKNWRLTHVLKWEAVNGPLPKGHCLKSIDGNRLNTDPSNWIAIPRSMLPRLTRWRDYDNAPADLKPTLLAMAKLEQAAADRKRRKPS